MLLRITPTMLHSIDKDGRIREVSDVWLAKLGYTWDEVIGRSSTDFLSEESARYARDVVLPTFYKTGICEVEYEMRRKDGALIPVRLHGVAVRSESGTFVSSIAVIEDLTELRALERKVLQAQKLESLALMAGNVAHDFNNLLASVLGNAQLSLRQLRHGSTDVNAAGLTRSLNDIITASTRAADLCQQLLAYSGRGRFQIDRIDVGAVVAGMAKVLEVNVGKSITVNVDAAREQTWVDVDPTQLRQVIMNLVLNAAEAMDGREGTIRITTELVDLDEATIATSSQPDVAPGRYVGLDVADAGCGMTADEIAPIFDPFYSTKATGRGLGLAAVHGIVRGHHGTLRVASEPGRGTTFTVLLPAAARPTAAEPEADRSRTTRRQVLVVDDDELVRRTVATQLEEEGYRVTVASSTAQATELATTIPFELFLVDLTMPGGSGAELANHLRLQVPTARIVLMSGYSAVDTPATTSMSFLRKPFTHEELLRALAEVSDFATST